MKLYKITIELMSPLVTALKGDTIWGHIVWGIANNEGEKAVSEFLKGEKESPKMIVSSAFPSGFICKPYPKPSDRSKQLSISEYAQIKQEKKVRFVPAVTYLSGNFEKKNKDEEVIPTKTFQLEARLHNSINRYSNIVIDGNLFTVDELWANQKKFDFYILSDFDSQRISQLCKWAFEYGYGADSSVGKGNITVKEDISVVSVNKKGKIYMALAPFVSNSDLSLLDMRADLFLRNGKLGGGFAGTKNPYKKTVLLYDEGAVFTSEKEIQYVGNLLTNIHSDERICQAGYAPVIPIE